MSNSTISRSFGTHDGTFHADEITACSLLLIHDLIDKGKIKRSRNPEILANCEFVCDVGGVYHPSSKRFDHHQQSYSGSLSSAGMILLYLRNCQVISEDVYRFLDSFLVRGVDAEDNGDIEMKVCSFSKVVSSFLPTSHSATSEEQDKAFFEALSFVEGFLKRSLQRYAYNKDCRQIVLQVMKKKTPALLFNTPIPWLDSFFLLGGLEHPALFIIMPAGNHWKLRGIPPSLQERTRVRLPLPASWGGLSDRPLREISGIEGAIFCHKKLFISIWATKRDALDALEITLQGK